jgi:hypothetical protein
LRVDHSTWNAVCSTLKGARKMAIKSKPGLGAIAVFGISVLVSGAPGAAEEGTWSKAGEETAEAASAVGDATVNTAEKAWDATKEGTSEAW